VILSGSRDALHRGGQFLELISHFRGSKLHFELHFCAAVFESAAYCARQLGLTWDFFACRQTTRLSQLKRDAVQSLNMSPMQAERSSADGLNSSANAVLGNAKTAKPRAASIPFRIVFMTFPLFEGAPNAMDDGYGVFGEEVL
jgi:hypothetical protein